MHSANLFGFRGPSRLILARWLVSGGGTRRRSESTNKRWGIYDFRYVGMGPFDVEPPPIYIRIPNPPVPSPYHPPVLPPPVSHIELYHQSINIFWYFSSWRIEYGHNKPYDHTLPCHFDPHTNHRYPCYTQWTSSHTVHTIDNRTLDLVMEDRRAKQYITDIKFHKGRRRPMINSVYFPWISIKQSHTQPFDITVTPILFFFLFSCIRSYISLLTSSSSSSPPTPPPL